MAEYMGQSAAGSQREQTSATTARWPSTTSGPRPWTGRWSAWTSTRGRWSWWRTRPPCEFPGDLAVLSFPSNQFGHQENGGGEEIVNLLKHVRPGNGFEFKGDMFDKVEVNGENEHPLFTFLKKSLPTPSDDSESLMTSPHFLIWKPVRRTDIAWNFEKFLIGKDGTPIKRYSRNFLTKDIEADIKNCL